MYEGIEYRGFGQDIVEELAKHAGVPVWNGLTNEYHPTQMLADMLTVREHFGKLKGLKLVYMGDARYNMGNSLMVVCSKLGLDFVACTNKKYFPNDELVAQCQQWAEEAGSTITLTEDVEAGTKDADIIYTDVWVSMGEPDEVWTELDAYTIEQRIQGFMDVYQKNGIDLLKQQDSFPPVSFGSTAETITQSNLHFQKLIDSSDPPTAVFFDCYLSAMGGLSAASQARISVPQDISFVCFDDDPLFKTMSATMTCVSQDLTSMGKYAVELLLKRIHGDYTDFPKIDMLDVVFHPRRSVKDLSEHNSTASGKD